MTRIESIKQQALSKYESFLNLDRCIQPAIYVAPLETYHKMGALNNTHMQIVHTHAAALEKKWCNYL